MRSRRRRRRRSNLLGGGLRWRAGAVSHRAVAVAGTCRAPPTVDTARGEIGMGTGGSPSCERGIVGKRWSDGDRRLGLDRTQKKSSSSVLHLPKLTSIHATSARPCHLRDVRHNATIELLSCASAWWMNDHLISTYIRQKKKEPRSGKRWPFPNSLSELISR